MSPRSRLASLVMAGVSLALLARTLRSRRAIAFAGRVVVIVGSSRGLGLVLARQFLAEGARVALVGRNEESLDRALEDLKDQGGEAAAYRCDVTDPTDVELMISRVIADAGRIDVLINNAGVIEVGPFEHHTQADLERALSTHLRGPLNTILAALPHMRQAGARRIVNISSIGGRVAIPHLLPYSVSKFALAGLSQGLRSELGHEGFFVTTVYPGLMRTGSTYNARFRGQHRREFAWFHAAASLPLISIDARRAARSIIDACRHGDAELTISWAARLLVLMHTLSPAATAVVLGATNRLLPGPAPDRGNETRSGWQSSSQFVPGWMTALGDRATQENNELPR